jgi:2-amino-4-hydroxy-6-hydroxymethyldihydropteridine diphosphokinase
MKKQLTKDLTLYFNNNYPYKSGVISKKRHIVTLGIGGNIGDVKRRFKKFYLLLKQDSRFDIVKTTPMLKNPPFGYLKQNDFLNSLVIIKTNLSPIQLLNQMQRYENRFGRVRSFQDAPRTLDIDIIFYDKIKMDSKRLTIPHKDWINRQSVTIPMKFLKQ